MRTLTTDPEVGDLPLSLSAAVSPGRPPASSTTRTPSIRFVCQLLPDIWFYNESEFYCVVRDPTTGELVEIEEAKNYERIDR